MKNIPVLFAMAALLGTGGCAGRGTPLTPQILTFNYEVMTPADASAFIASVRSGQTTVSELFSTDACNFTADFSNALTAPKFRSFGTPGQTGFNVNIKSTFPVNLSTTNDPSYCTALDEIDIQIGDQSGVLVLGTPTNQEKGRVLLDDGRQFRTSEFFQARIQAFDPSNRRSNGDFRFINRLSARSNTVLIVEGYYALTH